MSTSAKPSDALRYLMSLERGGFVDRPAGRRITDGTPAGFVASPVGKRSLRLGTEERFRREFAETLGGLGGHTC